jgi:putative sigma-54 modulation protein
MDIKIHSVRFDADSKLIDFVKSKVSKLSQFNDGLIAAEVYLRLDNSQDMENKITEIKLTYQAIACLPRNRAKLLRKPPILPLMP